MNFSKNTVDKSNKGAQCDPDELNQALGYSRKVSLGEQREPCLDSYSKEVRVSIVGIRIHKFRHNFLGPARLYVFACIFQPGAA